MINIRETGCENAEIIWRYLSMGLHGATGRPDLMLVMGSADLRVPRYAAQLQKRLNPNYIVISGGTGRITKGQEKSEAQTYAQVMQESGADMSKVILEERASNSEQNMTFTREIMDEMGITIKNGLIVTKPYMRLRAKATAENFWPQVQWQIESQSVGLREYLDGSRDPVITLNAMVGDMQRIRVYPAKGYQTPPHIPDEVWAAYEKLVEAGYDQQLV